MTSIEFLKTEYIKRGDCLPSGVFQDAKEMHKAEIADAWEMGRFNIDDFGLGEEYYQDTFVSKGSDEVELPKQETLYTEEQVREAIEDARDYTGYVNTDEVIKSLKQPKKD